MPTKIKSYKWVKFSPEVLQKALDALKSFLAEDQVKADYRIEVGGALWRYDYGDETTFFNDYQSDFRSALYKPIFDHGLLQVFAKWYASPPFSEVSIRSPKKSQIEHIFRIFEDAVATFGPPWKSQVKIFIGHGRSPQWKVLRDFLVKEHQLKVEAYEIGARAGLTTAEILKEMLEKSSFALLIFSVNFFSI